MNGPKIERKNIENSESGEGKRQEPVENRLVYREKQSQKWIEREGKRVLDEFLECEQFGMGDDDRRAVFVTNKTADGTHPTSPTAPTPQLLEIRKSVRVAYEHAIPKLTADESRRGIFLTMMAGLNVSHVIMLPFIMMRYGGFYFLLPLLLSTFLISFPVNFVQYCLSQFTNFPGSVVFARIAPVCSGTGVVVLFVQYFVAAGTRFDHRFITMALEFFHSLLTQREEGAEVAPDKVFDPSYQHSHYISAAFIFTALLFVTSLNGIKTFLEMIQYCIFPIMAAGVVANLIYLIGFYEDKALILYDVIGWEFSKLLEVRTWVVATLNSLVIFCTADGTFFAVGAVNRFGNNLSRDIVRAILVDLLMFFLLSFLFGIMTILGVGIFFSRVMEHEPSLQDYRSVIYSDTHVFEFLFTFFSSSPAFQLWMLLFSVLFTTWQLSSLMLQAHGAVDSFYRVFPSAARLPHLTVRFIFLFFHCAGVLFLHFFLYRFRHLPLLLPTHSVLLQVISFNVLGFRRLFIVFLTMCNKHRAFIYRFRKFLLFYFHFFLPFFALCPVVYEVQQHGLFLVKSTMLPALLISGTVLYRMRLRSKTFAAFRPTSAFRPDFHRDHAEFKQHEKAMSGKGKVKEIGICEAVRSIASCIWRFGVRPPE